MGEIDRLVDIMRTLRSEQGCPWDREQTLESLRRYAVEEVYEVLDAIDRGDVEDHCEELGDLLLQVVFQAQLRSEEGRFDFEDVARAISEKLIRRHPHVFGEVEVSGSEEVLVNWNRIKETEKSGKQNAASSCLDGVPLHLPALLRAQEIQKKAAKVGFDWDSLPPVLEKIREEISEVEEELASSDRDATGEEIGDLLFAVVNLARHLDQDAEQLLQDATRKFSTRFREVERTVQRSGRAWPEWSLEELEEIWVRIKLAGVVDS